MFDRDLVYAAEQLRGIDAPRLIGMMAETRKAAHAADQEANALRPATDTVRDDDAWKRWRRALWAYRRETDRYYAIQHRLAALFGEQRG